MKSRSEVRKNPRNRKERVLKADLQGATERKVERKNIILVRAEGGEVERRT